jgi:hypothetical protein
MAAVAGLWLWIAAVNVVCVMFGLGLMTDGLWGSDWYKTFYTTPGPLVWHMR